jgi:hypothetical protein
MNASRVLVYNRPVPDILELRTQARAEVSRVSG